MGRLKPDTKCRRWRTNAYVLCLIIVAISAALFGCDEPVVGPTPPPPPPQTTTTIPLDPPFNPGPMFDWHNVRGVLVFAATQADEGTLRSMIGSFRAAWPSKQLALNVCSETAEWEHTPWADGPPAWSDENRENLARFLAVTADEGVLVRLNIFCTARDNHGWMNEHWMRYTQFIVNEVRIFDHVLLSVANEPYHPNSWLRSGDRVRQVRDAARAAGFSGPMGADDTVSPRGNDYRYAYASLGFDADFHPFRIPVPGPSDFDRLVEENPPPVIISEPIAYSSWREGGCCTDDQDVILSYLRRCERRNIIWFYHSTDGLEWPRKGFEWIPSP